MIPTFHFSHPRLGEVYASRHATSCRFTARWTDGHVKMIVPRRATQENIEKALEEMLPKLLERKPKPLQVADIVLPDWSLEIVRTDQPSDKITLSGRLPRLRLAIGNALDINETHVRSYFDKAVMAAGKSIAAELLLPRAKEIASQLGCTPTAWTISRAHRSLGHCTAKGVVALSYLNVFLTPELRDYIVCHELAHLTHMNHSEKFHRLCNTYTGAREKELIAKLKHYPWPIRK